ncbi:hypothetical protein O9929_15130 [Vibrio lentus]|nr:hypothetical protein [Vibrio lentus]
MAEQLYKRLSPDGSLKLSENVTVYYGEEDFTDQLKSDSTHGIGYRGSPTF